MLTARVHSPRTFETNGDPFTAGLGRVPIEQD
jgi:hypothetical protein